MHVDWSVTPAKRWIARATLGADGRYHAEQSQRVEHATSLLSTLGEQVGQAGAALVGFDFPIGLPLAYARRAGIKEFITILPELGKDRWSKFYEPAHTPEEISIRRPFYPARAGNTRQQHLLEQLAFETINDIRRRCELSHPGRRAACPLFWTLGAQQVGKAAISGWRQVLVGENGILPNVSLWPFSGSLTELIQPGQVIVAETYPAEFYTHLGVRFSKRKRGEKTGKRSQVDRAANSSCLLEFAKQAGITLTPSLEIEILDGFGPAPDAEDRFDAIVGLFGMLNVVFGGRSPGEPENEDVQKIEGWILGQEWTDSNSYRNKEE